MQFLGTPSLVTKGFLRPERKMDWQVEQDCLGQSSRLGSSGNKPLTHRAADASGLRAPANVSISSLLLDRSSRGITGSTGEPPPPISATAIQRLKGAAIVVEVSQIWGQRQNWPHIPHREPFCLPDTISGQKSSTGTYPGRPATSCCRRPARVYGGLGAQTPWACLPSTWSLCSLCPSSTETVKHWQVPYEVPASST